MTLQSDGPGPGNAQRFDSHELREVAILQGLSDAEIAWFAAHGERIALAAGEHMFERGQPADFMFIVVSGAIEGYEEVGGEELLVATTQPGQVTGMLPYSRMTHYPRYTVAVQDAVVLRLDKRTFPEMLGASYEAGRRLVAEMSDRVRGDVRLEQQHERMAALGRLSAGLAHELNNPAAAVRRAAVGLSQEFSGLTELVARLVQHDVQRVHIEATDRLRQLAESRTAGELSPLARARHEEELASWLEDHAVPMAWDLAGTFADAGLAVEDLEEFAGDVAETLRADALMWVACGLDVRRMVDEVATCAARISELVASVKVYSHMDRSSDHQPTDVREGIENTLTLLGHRLKEKNISIVRDWGDIVPVIRGHAGELNQVWTNLIDNAIDAVAEGGQVRIDIGMDGSHVTVNVIDDGHGIPDEIRSRVFEPFFTTKDVGQGTGLGLDIATRIVRTHRGRLTLQSSAAGTVAQVRLPAAPSA